jgi:hypothetical protein
MTARYAEGTTVDSVASRAEIERTLARYGATSFAYGWDDGRAAIGFTANGRQVRFVLPMPDRGDREFTHTPGRGQRRSESGVATEYEKAVRQRWRALALVVKAKLEAVAAGIVTFDEEFLAHMVLPNGRSVYAEVQPAVDEAYRTGTLPPLMQLGRGDQ